MKKIRLAKEIFSRVQDKYFKYSLAFISGLVLSLFHVALWAQADDASPWNVPVKVVDIIRQDDQGVDLKFPSAVFFDRTMDETYVVSGNRIIIYGVDYFPKISVGPGRGIDSPSGLYVAGDGRLLVCQGQSGTKPPRLTVLNAAFLPLKEIYFDDFPDAGNFIPQKVTVGRKGKIYLTGANTRGVLVLDSNGSFLHWLKPQDDIWSKEPAATKGSGDAVDGSNQIPPQALEITEEDLVPPENYEGVPASRGDVQHSMEGSVIRGPVQVVDVVSDSYGHLFLLSEETSKVYVYDANENFIFSFGKKGGSPGKLSRPRGLAVDEKRKSIYVVDYMRHSVLVYNFSGRYIFEIGGWGGSPRWFNFPTALALNRQGNLIVGDLFNHRVQVLDVQFEPSTALFGSAESEE